MYSPLLSKNKIIASWQKLIRSFCPRHIKCTICGKELDSNYPADICDECYSKLPFVSGKLCTRCGKPIADETKALCRNCSETFYHYTYAYAPFMYMAVIKRKIYDLKYNNKPAVAQSLAMLLARQFATLDWHIDAITFVPLHPNRQSARGYNQSELIAMYFSAYTGLPVINTLKRVIDTPSQTQLTRTERIENIKKAIETNTRGNTITYYKYDNNYIQIDKQIFVKTSVHSNFIYAPPGHVSSFNFSELINNDNLSIKNDNYSNIKNKDNIKNILNNEYESAKCKIDNLNINENTVFINNYDSTNFASINSAPRIALDTTSANFNKLNKEFNKSTEFTNSLLFSENSQIIDTDNIDFNLKNNLADIDDSIAQTTHSDTTTDDSVKNINTNTFDIFSTIYARHISEIINGKNILIIDDIYTTGTTMEHCTNVLLKNKANKVYCLAIAHAVDNEIKRADRKKQKR